MRETQKVKVQLLRGVLFTDGCPFLYKGAGWQLVRQTDEAEKN
jgi:hypothetical protein